MHILYSGLGGHANVFFSMVKADADGEFEQEALFAGVEELRPEHKQLCDDLNITYDFIKKTPGLDLRFYTRLIQRIRRSKADIVFLHASANIIPAKIAALLSKGKKKIIVRETQANELKTKREWASLRQALRYADYTVFLSDNYKAQVRKNLTSFYQEDKVAVIPNGIDLELFSPVEKSNFTRMILGMQSRLVAIKDHITLLQAFLIVKERMKDSKLKLIIAGDGQSRLSLEITAKELGIATDVEFTGALGEDELASFIHSLDIYIHASLGETMSTAIMQAMACKKPVIASDVNGINNMIVDKITGLLVPVKDPEAMADAIQQLIDNQELAERLAAKAYKHAQENYSNVLMLERYKKLFYS